MVRDGYLYALGLGVVAMLLWLAGAGFLVPIPVLLACFFLWFFRDPQRHVPAGPGQIVSPADGLVTEAELIETDHGKRLRISVFLNVFDVHVNRSPIEGKVLSVSYKKGLFKNAMRADSGVLNEQTLITVDQGDYQVSFKQIAGLLARRIVCNIKEGDHLQRGERFGLMKFGSRMEVLMPPEATMLVKKGERVKGGSTILALMPQATPTPTSLEV